MVPRVKQSSKNNMLVAQNGLSGTGAGNAVESTPASVIPFNTPDMSKNKSLV